MPQTPSALLTPPGPALGRKAFPGLRRFSTAYFLAALSLLFMASPFLEETRLGSRIEAVLLTLMLSLAVLAVGGSRRGLIWAAALLVPTLVCRWLDEIAPGVAPDWILRGTYLAFIAFVIARLLAYILSTPRVNSEVLCAGVGTYLLMGMFWAVVYSLLHGLSPGAFTFMAGGAPQHAMTGFTALYFSFTTLTTVGYGDIIPVSPPARMFAMTEAVTGMFYVTILIARLVSMYSASRAETHHRG